uniref:Uncharacterized protein n=1 Tax=Glossina austeni TaxID=7395 RepID=A0A1A9V5N5_GLOAU
MELKEFCLKINFILRILLVISIVILSTVIIMELTSEPSILRIFVDSVKGTDEEKNLEKFENFNRTAKNEKFTRNIHENNTSKTKNYYEEQMPVVVYSRTDVDLPDNQNILTNQNAQENDNDNDSHYYDDNDADDADDDDDDDGFNENEGRGRSSHYNDYDMYYSQWRYTTSSPDVLTPKQGLKSSEFVSGLCANRSVSRYYDVNDTDAGIDGCRENMVKGNSSHWSDYSWDYSHCNGYYVYVVRTASAPNFESMNIRSKPQSRCLQIVQ